MAAANFKAPHRLTEKIINMYRYVCRAGEIIRNPRFRIERIRIIWQQHRVIRDLARGGEAIDVIIPRQNGFADPVSDKFSSSVRATRLLRLASGTATLMPVCRARSEMS